jgi:hypothetical protein
MRRKIQTSAGHVAYPQGPRTLSRTFVVSETTRKSKLPLRNIDYLRITEVADVGNLCCLDIRYEG